MPIKKKVRAPSRETTLRHVWLAGLGVIAVARRNAATAANDAVTQAGAFKRQAVKLASDTRANVREGIASVREQGESRVGQFSVEVEARLAPVLNKLGLKPASPRARKATRKTAPKRARATPARKPAAKRTVRRSRG